MITLEQIKKKKSMTLAPEHLWPNRAPGITPPTMVWISKLYLAQLFEESHGVLRLSINSTKIKRLRSDDMPIWKDGLTWDQLMEVKRQCGFANSYAVEIYPPDTEVVNVANMRHLWLLPNRIPGVNMKG